MNARSLVAAFVLLGLLLVGQSPRAAEIGDRIVWSEVTLVDGRTVRASELTGRTVVVEFWATWCPFCARQNPYVQKLHAAHGDKGEKGLIVLTFALDKDAQVVRKYMEDRKFTFAAGFAGPQTEAWFGRRRALPEVYVVDAQGRIVFKELGEMFEEDVAELTRFAVR